MVVFDYGTHFGELKIVSHTDTAETICSFTIETKMIQYCVSFLPTETFAQKFCVTLSIRIFILLPSN